MNELPEPVRRYLARAGRHAGDAIRIEQSGELRASTKARRWMPFRAVQEMRADVPSFHWRARVRPLPLLSITVADDYAAGEGAGEVRCLGLRLAHARGSREINEGALHRYLAEAVWHPAALRPSERLAWSPVADDRALATLTDGATRVSLEFRFDEAGDVASVFTPSRWAKLGKGFRQMPWEGRFHDYVDEAGARVPRRAEVGWHDGGKLEWVWRGRIATVQTIAPTR